MNEQRTIEVLVEAKTENKVLNRIITTAIPSKRDNQKEAGPSAVLKTEMTKYFWDTGKVTPYPLNAPKYFIFFQLPYFRAHGQDNEQTPHPERSPQWPRALGL